MTAVFPTTVQVETSPGLTLSWLDITASVRHFSGPGEETGSQGNKKIILNGVTGHVGPGSLLAILGSSGSGKTTLLNALTSRNVGGYEISGDIFLNGVPIQEEVRNVSAYVQQSDVFLEILTPREQLQFRAHICMDRRLSKQQKMVQVENVIVEMGLSKCADTRIGSSSGSEKCLSGGERKRLSFACEALCSPSIFICDEPTSGLDTFMAASVVKTLEQMAKGDKAVLCTIHQPSSEIFSLFHRVLILSEGRVAFMGRAQEALDFFKDQGYPCPMNYNPADHYIQTLAIEPGEREEKSRKRGKTICSSFLNSPLAARIEMKLQRQTSSASLSELMVMSEVSKNKRHTPGWWTEFRYLFWRSLMSQFRDRTLSLIRVLHTVVVGLILGLVFLRLEIHQTGVLNVKGALFLLITNVCLTNLFTVLSSFTTVLPVVMREYGSGLYRMDTFFISKVLSEIPILLLTTALFVTVTYWMIGFRDDVVSFSICLLVLSIVAFISIGLGYLISIMCGTITMSMTVASPVLTPFMLFGGIFLNAKDVPDYFKWMEAISFFKYANDLLNINQWGSVDAIECDKAGVSPVPGLTFQQQCLAQFCQYSTGQDVLDFHAHQKEYVERDFAILSAIGSSLYILAFLALLIRARLSRE